MSELADIKSHRLKKEEYEDNFSDIEPPLNADNALIESERCYFCYDAPCIEACPTDIDIPSFIRKINTKNIKGAAHDILSENIMGGTCARACPVETLCEDACVRTAQSEKPVAISLLQRYATDYVFDKDIQLFKKGELKDKKIAIVGAGPAGLSCAHRLATLGYESDIFEAKDKAGGLNEYGLAQYKMVDDFAQKEIEYLLQIGGMHIHHNKTLGQNLSLTELAKQYSAVFLGLGLTKTNLLNLDNESVAGVYDAIDFIEEIRITDDLSRLPCPKHAIVIGGGNTAIDIASQIKRLGAEVVTLVYRRGQGQMNATFKEQELAKIDGVDIRYFAAPKELVSQDGKLKAVVFEKMLMDEKNSLKGSGESYTLKADMLFKAIGQKLDIKALEETGLDLEQGRIKVNQHFKTNLANVFAGGDCIKSGEDLTVQSVQDGKLAAHAIAEFLQG